MGPVGVQLAQWLLWLLACSGPGHVLADDVYPRWLPRAANHSDRRQAFKPNRAETQGQLSWNPLAGFGHQPQVRWKRRLPFLVRRKWCGWPMRGRRIGEASKPGPAGSAAMDVDSRGQTRAGSPTSLPAAHRSQIEEQQRVYCPVIGCPASQPASARGWGSQAMRAHLDDHAAGSLAGDIPVDYLASQRLQLCGVCGLLVAQRLNGHPRCRPATRAAAAAVAPGPLPEPPEPAMPDLVAIMEPNTPTQRHVPKAAQAAWAQCLARALCEAASANTSAWTRLLLLPNAVLCPPPRGGTARRDHTAQFTLRRCRRWLAGERAGLWQAPARRERRREADGPAAVP